MKVIYLSSTELGKSLFEHLKKLPVEIVYNDFENKPLDTFPEYDLGISFLYTHKIPSTEFITPKKWINFHPGALPEFGGRDLAYHAIMNESDFFGASIHYMNEEFDAGEIIETIKFPIAPNDTAGDLVKKSYTELTKLFHKYIGLITKQKSLKSSKQIDGKYYKKSKINDNIPITIEQKKLIRALTVEPRHFPIIEIDGRTFKIIPADEK